ncbi:tRNA (guanine37-N1)-methyltransferase [Oceanithermus desulfurans]|uniref:tRNA (guanine-N(1)-)-methyltransferase n=2 Tax=Oceanithermus desulfurans TaxID=227924 RepID=A0A511RJL2_9DEIN|nr:tRNA (guanine37-N1)-methyltransferase [Oceanithermus desulfurans]GEM89006.1 tRNA (guanine-N(1)-)-methyltransferase [Oceanithermus desulfurans NBRC 100063]
MLRYTVLTLFPRLIEPWMQEALLAKAVQRGLIEIRVRDIRNYAKDKHRQVDDYPYGGGAGMVLRPDVVVAAIEDQLPADEVILLTPAGEPLRQPLAEELAAKDHLVLVSGRYEGIDARVENFVTREVSIGDFVLMGGEVAALAVIEATARLVPGVLGDPESHRLDSFSWGLLDYPQYTRPPEFRGLKVPEVLTSGHHGKVAEWRRREALKRTLERRPDLLAHARLNPEDLRLLAQLDADEDAPAP